MQAAASVPVVPMQTTSLPLHGHGRPHGTPAEVGKQFEGIFASMLLKQMRQGQSTHGMFGHDPSDICGGMFDHFIGQHIAQRGSLGIAAMVQKYLEKRGA